MTTRQRAVALVYQLKVTLKDTKPPIWRRIQVPGNITLNKLHDVLQVVMGWTDSHLHMFIIDRDVYAVPHPDDMDPVINEKRVKLSQVVKYEKDRFIYDYDFGDDWDHRIQVEKILPPGPATPVPVCLAGRRCCPPEDCGGPWSYQALLDILKDPVHPHYEETREWLGDSFDPEEFDLDAVNEDLRDGHGGVLRDVRLDLS